MNLITRLTTSFRRQGIGATFIKIQTLLVDHWFDFRYGVDTCSCAELDCLTVSANSKSNGYRYQPARVRLLRMLFKALEPTLPTNRVLVDFGSGKGRVLMVASARFAASSSPMSCAQSPNKIALSTKRKVEWQPSSKPSKPMPCSIPLGQTKMYSSSAIHSTERF